MQYVNFELGTGMMLTEKFIVPGLTQNIATCYNFTICNYSYDTNISYCTKQHIPKQLYYPIVNDPNHVLYIFHQ